MLGLDLPHTYSGDSARLRLNSFSFICQHCLIIVFMKNLRLSLTCVVMFRFNEGCDFLCERMETGGTLSVEWQVVSLLCGGLCDLMVVVLSWRPGFRCGCFVL